MAIKDFFKYLSEFVRPVCLPYEDSPDESYAGRDLIIAGWGYTKMVNEEGEAKAISNILCNTNQTIKLLTKFILVQFNHIKPLSYLYSV